MSHNTSSRHLAFAYSSQFLPVLITFLFCVFGFIGSISAQTSFSNIAFDGPDRYVPEGDRVAKSAAELRRMKDQIRAFPSRLDFRYAYLYELSNSGNWKRLSEEVIALVGYSYDNEHRWIWNKQYNAIGEDAEHFLLNTVEDYVFMLYITEDEQNYAYIDDISAAVLEDKPDHRDFLTYPAMTRSAQGKFAEASKYLHRAENIHREDGTVAILLADNYLKMNNTNLALSYYEKAVRFGNERDIIFAQRAIDKLSRK